MNYKGTIIILVVNFFAILTTQLWAQSFEIDLLRKINNSNEGMRNVSIFADKWTVPIALGIPTIIGGIGLINKDKSIIRDALYVGASVGIDALLVNGIKLTVQRTRPFIEYPDLMTKYVSEGSYSFPSGHTSSAFALATALTIKYQKWYVAVPAYMLAGYVGYSRMHVGVHYPTDVLAGAVLGVGSAWLTWEVNKLIK